MTYYYVYTDGSCRNNGTENAVGAWGYIIYINKEHQFVDQFANIVEHTTNQRMELLAMLAACQHMEPIINGFSFDEVHFYTDSAYLHNCITQKWYEKWQRNGWVNSKKQPVANQDLWEKLIPYFTNPQFYFHKCQGHSDNEYNNKIDALVQSLTEEFIKNGSNN